MKLYLATGNAHKAQEFDFLLKGHGLNLSVASAQELGGMPEVDENAPDFAGNAKLKAEALFDHVKRTQCVLADDSGLCVQVLEGAPGVRSARYAGKDATDQSNCEKLLREMTAFKQPAQRVAWFQCTLCLLQPTQPPLLFEGRCEGLIAMSPEGSEGFGYDPLFIPDGFNVSFASLGDTIKSRISHRARAVAELLNYFKQCTGGASQ